MLNEVVIFRYNPENDDLYDPNFCYKTIKIKNVVLKNSPNIFAGKDEEFCPRCRYTDTIETYVFNFFFFGKYTFFYER